MNNYKTDLDTDRLLLTPLRESDYLFIHELLNTEGWIKFIGNRNIYSTEDAIAYINKINAAETIAYWTVKLKENELVVGLVTVIQRDYLNQPDIGFAFLPQHARKGYAYEASKELMNHILQDENVRAVHAVTLPDNVTSISLAKKLGLSFDKIIDVNEESLHLYTYKK